MTIKDFFKPEWKKFILPIIIIILFLVTIKSFYSIGDVMDKYICKMLYLSQEKQDYLRRDNILAANQTYNQKLLPLYKNLTDDLDKIRDKEPLINFFYTINPVIPMPCRAYLPEKSCKFYINEETYRCRTAAGSYKGTGESPMPYRKPTLFNFGLNILLLFFEGYIISSIILGIFRKLPKSNRKNQ